MAAPRRLQSATSASSTTPPLSSHAVPSSEQKTLAERGQVSRAIEHETTIDGEADEVRQAALGVGIPSHAEAPVHR
jgi:hypothetical protein